MWVFLRVEWEAVKGLEAAGHTHTTSDRAVADYEDGETVELFSMGGNDDVDVNGLLDTKV